MTPEDFRKVCVDLQSLGVRFSVPGSGRSGGAGPAEGQTIIIGGRYLNVPTQSWYVTESPYSIEPVDRGWLLLKDGMAVSDVQLPPVPAFYDCSTAGGLKLSQVALLHGSDCLASTVYQSCVYWNTPWQCAFCGIGLSLERSSTILLKDPVDLAHAAVTALRLDGVGHITLTTGVWTDEKSGIAHLCACASEIKKKSSLPVHVQVHPPQDTGSLARLKDAGVDTIGIHIETATPRVLAAVAPGKAGLGLFTYADCWDRAVALFGRNQVSTFLIAGLGETADQLMKAVNYIAQYNVFPYVLPLRPIPGTPLADSRPPVPSYMLEIYSGTAEILKSQRLSSVRSMAGCVRCGACSCLGLFEDTGA